MKKYPLYNVKHLKHDALASIVVFLVAIPLCLGIALACGVPLFSGIITGVIGGIVVGILSESQLSVSGPAAGMIAVVIASIHNLGSYEAFLFALVLAGLLQILCGYLKAGYIANYVPANVIQGLLAAIGILIVIKQLPFAVGYYAEAGHLQHALAAAEGDLSINTFTVITHNINYGATTISAISLFLLLIWDKLFKSYAKIIPASVAVVLLAVIINKFFLIYYPALALQSFHLVNIPVNESFNDFLSQFKHPNFQVWANPNVYVYAFMIAIVASLETLLNLEAVEQLDKRHRYCSRSKELIAQGVGNTLSGLIGGLPVTSVIVRSSVNIEAGATTKMSTIIHGFLLLLSITFASAWLNEIPTAALASILIFTGYKLANIKLFKEVFKEGARYSFPFIVTVIAIVTTNILLGIVIGLTVSIIFILQFNSKNGFTIVEENHSSGKVLRFILPQQVTFLNKAAIIADLNKKIPPSSKVIIDANATDYIDNDILHVIKQFKQTQAVDKRILINLEGFKKHYDISNQIAFINVTTYDVQSTLSPLTIQKILREGNERFKHNRPIHKNFNQQIMATSKSQHPLAVILSCIDSRVPVEIIFDQSVGDLFVTRIAGNVVNDDILASIEYACEVAGAKLIVVLGHKECGAIKAACDNVHIGHITQLVKKIQPAIESEHETKVARNSHNSDFVMNVTCNNVELSKNLILEKSKILRDLIHDQKVGLVGGFYDVMTGSVIYDETGVTK